MHAALQCNVLEGTVALATFVCALGLPNTPLI